MSGNKPHVMCLLLSCFAAGREVFGISGTAVVEVGARRDAQSVALK